MASSEKESLSLVKWTKCLKLLPYIFDLNFLVPINAVPFPSSSFIQGTFMDFYNVYVQNPPRILISFSHYHSSQLTIDPLTARLFDNGVRISYVTLWRPTQQ